MIKLFERTLQFGQYSDLFAVVLEEQDTSSEVVLFRKYDKLD